MVAAVFHQAIGTQYGRYIKDSSLYQEYGNVLTKFNFNSLRFDSRPTRKCQNSREKYVGVVAVSASHSSALHPVSAPSQISTSESLTGSNEVALILLRHGESVWNEKNLFTGCVDVPLTKKGVKEAIEAGRRISNIPIDVIYTSALVRAQMTAMLAMTQHRSEKVPIIMRNENEQAKEASQVYSDNARNQSIPVIAAWQLNERMYGNLQGFNKQKTAEKYGEEQVYAWRRCYDVIPPNGESLEMCAERAVAYFRKHIETQLKSRQNVMVAAHANSLRAIIMYLDRLTSEEVINLELSNATPMLYIVDQGKFIRRGSPVSPTESGVYAYSKTLAQYRQRLDDMLN